MRAKSLLFHIFYKTLNKPIPPFGVFKSSLTNKKGKKLFGGIVIPNDDSMVVWKINEDKNYDYDNGNWEVLK